MSDAPVVDTDAGVRDILERMDGGAPTNLLPDEPAHREPAAPSPQEDAEAVADQLRRDADNATARARAAEQRATQEAQARQRSDAELQRTRQSQYDAEFGQVSSQLVEREEERERLKADIRAAADTGDHARMADINYRLGELGAEVRDLRIAKQQFEADRSGQLRQPAPQPAAPAPAQGEWTTVGVPREQFLAGRTSTTQEWLRQHDEFFTDPKVNNMVMGAHSLAVGKGITPDTPAYFRFIEEQAGMSGSRSQSRGSTAPPAVPPSRDAPGPSGRNRSGDIHISADQVRAAKWMMDKMPGGYTAEDAKNYAIEQAELNRRGDLPLRRR